MFGNDLKNNLMKATALFLTAAMILSTARTAWAGEIDLSEEDIPIEIEEIDIAEETEEVEEVEEAEEELTDEDLTDELLSANQISKEDEDEAARERESMPGSDCYSMKLLTYLSKKYPDIGIDLDGHRYDYSYNADKMTAQTAYSEIVIDGNDSKDITKNMVQFKMLGCFGDVVRYEDGEPIYSDTVKTLVIRNVDEIRNLYVPSSVETLIIENTTLNCYYWESDAPGFQCGMQGDLRYCKNLKSLVLRNVKFGDNYKNMEDVLPELTGNCPYEINYRLNLQNCHNLEKLEIIVDFSGAGEVKLAIDGGTENLFENLSDKNCYIYPAPGIGCGQVSLYANENSYPAKKYASTETVKFKNELFRLWLIEAIEIDTYNDGVISKEEMDAIETLTINNETARYRQSSLSDFHELADIGKMHGLKTLEIDFYDPDYHFNDNRHPLEGIDFPDSIENLSLKNIYWEKNTQTKSHDNADIVLTNLKNLVVNNTDVCVRENQDSYFSHSTQIKLTDTEGVLESVMLERCDVESVELTNISGGKNILTGDEKHRIRFSASDCEGLKSVEFLGEGYALEGSVDLTNDIALTHIGCPNGEDNTKWTIYGEFDTIGTPVNISLISCSALGMLGTDSSETVIDYNFVNGRNLNVQTMDTSFSNNNKLIIYRNHRKDEDKAGKVYLSCDDGSWEYKTYKDKDELGYEIKTQSSFPTIAVLGAGQKIRTSNSGESQVDGFTKETSQWVNRWEVVMQQNGYSNGFANIAFYVVDNDGGVENLRKVSYKGEIGYEIEQHPDEKYAGQDVVEVNGSKLISPGAAGTAIVKVFVTNESGEKSYIGYANVRIFNSPDSVEIIVNDSKNGTGTKDDPIIIDDETGELALTAVLKVDGVTNDNSIKDIYWRIKEYDQTKKYTSDSDQYSLFTLDSATKAGISVIDDSVSDDGHYNTRKFLFNTKGKRFKVVAQSPFKLGDKVISSEVFVQLGGFFIDEIEDQIYTGQAIKPKVNIGYRGKPLVEGKDYSLSYKANKIVASKNAVNKNGVKTGPSVTITGKGNYTGKSTVYFSIVPANVSGASVDDILVAQTGKNIKISPIVKYNGKTLKPGSDYIVTDSNKDAVTYRKDTGAYDLYIVGINNYTGSRPFRFTIADDVLASKVSIKKIGNKGYNKGSPIVLGDGELKVTYQKEDVTDKFEVEYADNTEVGTAKVIIKAKENSGFIGSKTATFKITENRTKISGAKLGENGKGKIPVFIYSGRTFEPEIGTGTDSALDFYVGTEKLIKDTDYTVLCTNNVNAGNALLTITGIGKYTGTKTIKYKIDKYNVTTDDNLFHANSISVPYEKGGVKPKPVITMGDAPLTEGIDYTLSYSNNNAVGDASAVKAPTIKVTFKGNYTGNKLVEFKIDAKKISECKMTINDKKISTKVDDWMQKKFSIIDSNGKVLSAGKDYDKTVEYYKDAECSKKITDATLDAGTTVYVRVEGINNYVGTIVGYYRISEINISSVNASIEAQSYPGHEVCPKAEDILVTVGKAKTPLVPGEDYVVVEDSYKNNNKCGTASVTIRGMGDYFGTKVVKYKIGTKKFFFL